MVKDRKLSSQEKALWHHVTRSMTPMHPHKIVPEGDLSTNKSAPSKKAFTPSSAPSYHQAPKHPPHMPKQMMPLDGATQRRLRRGKMPIEGKLDLHGHRQAEAHRALEDFIAYSRRRGRRCVLVVTGKGNLTTPYTEGVPGVLRQRVPEWLRTGHLAQHIVGIEQAHPRHGGSGALYVILRTST